MGLKNPIGRPLAEKYIYLDTPETAKKIESLKKELEQERAKPPKEVIKEVQKTVLKDENLLPQLNAALKEAAVLRAELARKIPHVKERIVERDKTVEKPVEVIRIVHRKDKRAIAIASVVSFLLGGALCHFLL